MHKILIIILYLTIFIFSYLGFFSFSSFFHTLLDHDINVLEEWLYHNRLFIITSAKLTSYLMVIVFPNLYAVGPRKMWLNFKLVTSELLKQWKVESKDWIIHLIFCFILYAQFFQIEVSTISTTNLLEPVQVFYCLVFWACDFIFISKHLNFELTKYSPQYPLIDCAIVCLLPLITTSIVSYTSTYNLLQFYAIFVSLVYLMKTEKLMITGSITLIIMSCFFAVTYPLNFLTNLDDTWWSLKADGFSMPWSLIFILYVLFYKVFKNYINNLYKTLFFKIKN